MITRRVRHRKGGEYNVIGVAKMQTDRWFEVDSTGKTTQVDMMQVVIYQAEDGTYWVRPKYEFEDGRFTDIGLNDFIRPIEEAPQTGEFLAEFRTGDWFIVERYDNPFGDKNTVIDRRSGKWFSPSRWMPLPVKVKNETQV